MTEGPNFNPPKLAFNPPPNWPVEPGFDPPDRWTPDPIWGPAPEGWAFWLPEQTSTSNEGEPPFVQATQDTTFTTPIRDDTPAARKMKKRWLPIMAAIVATAIMVGGVTALVQHQQRLAEQLSAAGDAYDSSASALNTSISTAEEVLSDSVDAVLEESSRELLTAEIAEAVGIAGESVDLGDVDALPIQTSRLDDARLELDDAALKVDESMVALIDLETSRAKMTDSMDNARGEILIAERLVVSSDGKVTNESLRTDLAETIETVRTHVAKDPTLLNASALGASNEELDRARQAMSVAKEKVKGDQENWQKAADEAAAAAALVDPSSYASISSRDWQLVERDPAAHVGKKYVIFGKVTQFDSNTGQDVFRANTDGQKQSRSYNYDVNTMVVSSEELLMNVVQGDLVMLHVSIVAPYSYETTMGANLTVPMVKANIIDVYGSD